MSAGVPETLARILGDALGPLAARLQADGAEAILEEAGLRLPAGALATGAVPQGLQAAAAACAALPDAVAALVAAIAADDATAILQAATQVGQRIVQAGTAFAQVGSGIDATVQATAGLTPAQKARLGAAARALPERLLGLALIDWVSARAPTVKSTLELAGLFDDTPVPGDPADPSLPPHRERRVRFDRIAPLLSDPGRHLRDLYGFGRPDFDGLELLGRLKRMLDRPDGETLLIAAPGQPAALEAFVFRLAVEPGAMPGLRLRVRIPAEKDVDVAQPLGGPWSATASARARFAGGLEMVIDPETGVHVAPPAADAAVDLAFGLAARNPDGAPMVLLGGASGSRLELGEIRRGCR